MNGVFVHESAVVDDGAIIGEGTKIWHFCHVMAGARIGRGCVLGQNVYVAGTAVLGDNVKVQNNVSIYDGVELGDDVFVGPSAVFTNVSTPRSAVSRKGAFERTLVGRGATIGANATIVCGHAICGYAFVGAGAVVTKDVPGHALVVGNPARRVGWICACGSRLLRSLTCEECGATYKLEKGNITPQPPLRNGEGEERTGGWVRKGE
ncbi:MAG TPA: DapH/DapD/GlmU-related protein [Polyangia bacterium]|nr:DapH/DapD/GlmU-related protein [Polyangia bacterium]